ncbi:hypothetical protein PR048_020111 [Dryococelus australis]|uniref:Uncharacterized protein n=1 Tax=Dryococelus australis TaxID=614101 RepID=A0ABQ9H5R9_9NEOP|nr:hypothetical protein PR048_020111 [Dryococelus australis]
MCNLLKVAAQRAQRRVSLWRCYFRSCWLRFSLGGVLKLLGDCVGLVGPLGISVIIDYVAKLQGPSSLLELSTTVHYPTWEELYCNGYVMAVVVFLSALAQGTFSQSSTHLVNVEGIHLKGALQVLCTSPYVYRAREFLC